LRDGEPVQEMPSAVAGQFAELVAQGLSMSGEGGLLQQLTKLVLESCVEGEMDAHLGLCRGRRRRWRSGNSRNGKRPKTVLTEAGPVENEVPRDRDVSFDPQIVRKRQRLLAGVDCMVLSLSAKGLTAGEISVHLAEAYGAAVSKDTIFVITRCWRAWLNGSLVRWTRCIRSSSLTRCG
jgi:transposase-like protein